MNIRQVRKLLAAQTIGLEFSVRHALVEAKKDGLMAEDLTAAVLNGEVVEDYGERVLLLHFAEEYNMPFHVVLEYFPGDQVATVVTAYVPSRERWEANWKTRKRDRRKKKQEKRR